MCRAQVDLELSSVVIDAGHGGKDPGCISADRKNYEKTFTLDIAARLADRIKKNYPQVKVYQTRTGDVFVSLDNRAVKANSVHADLFISIHVNSTGQSSPNGFSVHILGQSQNKNKDLYAYNMDVCKRENSVILLEDDFSAKNEGFDPSDPESYIFMVLMQNVFLEQSLKFAQTVRKNLKGGPIKEDRGVWQNPFYVLWKTSMPAVLVELGFMSNAKDLAALRSSANRDNLAQRLFMAFKEYKTQYDAAVKVSAPERASVEKEDAGVTEYGTQVLASSKLIPLDSPIFLGYEPRVVKVGKLYKYIIGVSEDKSEAMRIFSQIKKKKTDCFFTKIPK